MKKLYRKGTVHPSPLPPSQPIYDHLAFLPATILTLTVALSPQDKEVLAYLISCSSSSSSSSSCHFPGNRRNTHKSSSATSAASNATSFGHGGSSGKSGDHPTQFNCNCFRCYMSYWVRWDSSPNRQLIHEIIDAFEDSLVKREKNKKDRRKKMTSGIATESSAELTRPSELSLGNPEFTESNSVVDITSSNEVGDEVEEEGSEKGPVRKIVSFLGERIWGVWS